MSANPLEDDPEREHRIRERAYHLWIEEGRPHGRDAEFWERARELVAMRDSAGSGQLPNPLASGEVPTGGEPVEEAFLQENLGEFPDRLADQGEVAATPQAAPRARVKPATPAPVPAQQSATAEQMPAKPSVKAKVLAAVKKSKPKG